MAINLTPDQEARLNALVAIGNFTSIEEAARRFIDVHLAELAEDDADDMAWAKSRVDEARAAVARGEFITLEQHRARNAARIAALRI